ncbi:hypothetical protein DPMN_089623 [Dreissena polymorpha]|uniref:Uncharacterized protein n=1 Tax=Dreissena polymorpha TaxID=45954 RepID=A0A9D4QY97_DREPO|nr:hypothetical protein DPMN_089623 [Dreissena polymorpha]
MVIPSGICVHPIGSTSCSMVPSYERRKPGTTLQGGVALALHKVEFNLRPSIPRSAAGACASRPRRESPAEDFLTCTYFLIEGNFCGWLC